MKLISILLLLFFISINFEYNSFRFAKEDALDFDKGSEALVLGAVVANRYNVDMEKANLGFVADGVPVNYPNNIYDSYEILAKGPQSQIFFSPYYSQYGIQGKWFSEISNWFEVQNVQHFRTLVSMLLSTIIVLLTILYKRIYNNLFAFLFVVTTVTSPWIIAFSKNLYWLSFLWFLPSLFSALLYLEKNRYLKKLYFLCIFLTIFIKSLSGYEYLSTITLMACSVFITAPFFQKESRIFKIKWKEAVIVFGICVLGFMAAFVMHAKIRGTSIGTGITNIIETDVKRRTYGDSKNFTPAYRASLETSPFVVLAAYTFKWRTNLFLWLPGQLFPVLGFVSFFILIIQFRKKDIKFYRNLVLLLVNYSIPVSWFILAKGHSFIHRHMNYVLWYLGFIPALVFVCCDYFINTEAGQFCLQKINNVKLKIRKL